MTYTLKDLDWKLMGHWPYAPLSGTSMETGGELMGVTEWVDARVPGSVHADLVRAGLLPDPYFEKNSLLCEWVEHRWWQYRVKFRVPEEMKRERFRLIFKGVDYAAHFYLNGHRLGWHEGMYDPVRLEAGPYLNLEGENQLDVLVESIPWENGQLGYTSRTITQKSRFGYKWDFGTRLVNLGLWDEVLLENTGSCRLESVYLTTSVEEGVGLVKVQAQLEGLAGQAGGAQLCARLTGEEGEWTAQVDAASEAALSFRVEQPRLWYPNGLGEQPLYQLQLELVDEGGVSDRWQGRVGIRSLSYRQNEGARPDSLPYTVVVNGRPVYLMGVNMTPLDHMYGAVTREDYRRTLSYAKALGVNLIRVWGGGVIEKECFYELCDELGLMVWQEFIQSSSGLDNIPSKRPEFLALLKTAARWALTRRRNHVCHVVWSGGNELMDATGKPCGYGDENIFLLKGLCDELDPGKLFLPTSASGPTEWLLTDRPGMNDDVHGNWKYEGPVEHYRRFNASDSQFHSEFGVDGVSSRRSLARVLGEAHLRPASMREDLVWRHHGEWWDTYGRDCALFGESELDQWILLSQFVQAEGLRYALEANRRRQGQNSGSIIWQFNEPWPNTSCTSLLEYLGVPKMAYYWVRKAYQPVALSLRHEGLIQQPDAPFEGRLFLANSLGAARYTASIRLLSLTGEVLSAQSFPVEAADNRTVEVGEVSVRLPRQQWEVFLAELILLDAEGRGVFDHRMLFSQREERPFAALPALPSIPVRLELQGNELLLTNEGRCAALFVNLQSAEQGRSVLFSDNYLCLLPGERVSLSGQALDGGELPELSLGWLNC